MSKLNETELAKYSSEFSESILQEMFNLLAEEGKVHGENFVTVTSLTVLASLVCTLVHNRLSKQPEGRSLADVNKDYREYKASMQNAIAAGFQSAFQHFSGQNVDYDCQIVPIPDPINKLPC